MRDGADSRGTRQDIRDIQLELQALIAGQGSNGPRLAADPTAGGKAQPPEHFRRPATATCASYNALDPSAAEKASVNAALTAYAEGFAGALIDYEACGATSFDKSGYVEHLVSFCREQPEKSLQASVFDYLCSDGS